MKIDEAVAYYHDTMAVLARAVGLSRGAVMKWKIRNCIPYARQCQIQVLTRGALKARKEDDLNYKNTSS